MRTLRAHSHYGRLRTALKCAVHVWRMAETFTGASQRWDEMSNLDQAGTEVTAIVRWLRQNDTARLARAKSNLSRYEGCALPGLAAAAYLKPGDLASDGDYKRLRWNVPRSLCQTVQAKLAGKSKPKVQFVTSFASWQQRRRAYHLDRFQEAQFYQRQGDLGNAWEVGALVLLHSLVAGDGLAYVYADDIAEQVAVEPVFPWQLFVDPNDAAQGRPKCLFLSRPFDRDVLAASYKDKPEIARKIMLAPAIGSKSGGESVEVYYKGGVRSSEQIEVIDAWALPTTKGETGTHLRCIDGTTLEREGWKRTEFPFARMRWAKEVQGFWSKGLIDEASSPSDEVNALVERLRQCVNRANKGVLLHPTGSLVNPKDLEGNDDSINVEYNPAYEKPTWVNPEPFDSATLEWLRMNLEQCYALPGVSQMAATARKEQGVTAAIALRTIDDQQTERLGTQQNGYELFFVDLARHMIACTRELAAKNPDFKVSWPGEGFLREIKWRDVDLPEDAYIMQPHPVSNIKNTPTDRLQLAQDMFGAGLFGKAAFEQSIKYLNAPDHLAGGDKQSKLIDRYIESWLDATPETLADGSFKFRSPFPYLNMPAAMLQVAEAYVEAQLDEAPDFNLEFFLRWIEQANEIVTARAAAQAPPAPPGAVPLDSAGTSPLPVAPPAPVAPPPLAA